jgi:hypothetical protein
MSAVPQTPGGADPAQLRWLPLGAAISAISVVGIAIGLGTPLLSVILESRGHSATMIGLNTAVAGIASIAAAPLAIPLAVRFGVVATMLAMILAGALAFVGFHVAPSFWMWFPLRAVLHVALTVLFILSEYWISASAPPHRRGFVLGIYATVLSLGFALGPWLFAHIGSQGFLPFGVTFAITMLAAIPVVAAWRESPRILRSDDESRSFAGYILAGADRDGRGAGLRRGRDRRVRPVPGLRQPRRLFGSGCGPAPDDDRPRQRRPPGAARHDQRPHARPEAPAARLRDDRARRHRRTALSWRPTGTCSPPCFSSGAAWWRRSTRSASRTSGRDSPDTSWPRPTPPSSSATASA